MGAGRVGEARESGASAGRRGRTTRRERPILRARLALWVFYLICALAIAQVAWWIVFLARIAPDRRYVVMIVSEGSVFLIAMLLGVYVIYGSLSEQVRLKQMRATFLAAVTHELRSPLASIRLFLETIARGRVTDAAKVQELVAKMLVDTDRLERLVEGLLRAGELETDALRPVLAQLDLTALAREALEAARLRLFAAADDVALEAPDGALWIDGDARLLRGVLDNLLENAAKYSPPPRWARLRLSTDERDVVVEVADKGLGLDAEAKALVFRPFFRAGDEATRQATGTGLGLYLVDGIVRAHGGRCEALSDGPGAGTCVRLRLPRGAAAPASTSTSVPSSDG